MAYAKKKTYLLEAGDLESWALDNCSWSCGTLDVLDRLGMLDSDMAGVVLVLATVPAFAACAVGAITAAIAK